MPTLTPAPVAPTRMALGRLLAQAAARARRLERAVLVSHTEWMDRRDPLALFAAAEGLGEARLFWEHREDDVPARSIAGLGAAYRVTAQGSGRFADADSNWDTLLAEALIALPDDAPRWGAGPLLLGGFRFDPLAPHTEVWAAFPDALLILPRLTLVRADDDRCLLTLNALVGPDTDTDPLAKEESLMALRDLALDATTLFVVPRTRDCGHGQQHLHAGTRTPVAETTASGHEGGPSAAPDPLKAEDVLPTGAWQGAVADTARQIREGRYEKVVLARKVRLHSPQPFDAAAALARLRDRYPNAFLFAVGLPEVTGDEALFLGATPERLIRLEGELLETSVLAGSTRRGATPEEDRTLGESLLASAKDRHEHQVVATMLQEALAPLCRRLDIAATPGLLRLANVQHLHTPVRGLLTGGISILDLVARLHPTPAVGGMPREGALAAIREREAMDRGWYAAPVGWVDRHGQGEFAVALRSALLHNAAPQMQLPSEGQDGGGEALLFAGCGIMGDSDPDREYAESAMKLRAMLAALEG